MSWHRAARVLRSVREDLNVVVARDPATTSVTEALLHPCVPAMWMYRLAHPLHRRHRVAARLLSTFGRLVSGGIEIHPGATLGRRVFIDHGAGVVIGETAVVGDDVTIYQHVTLGAVGWWRDNLRAAGQRRHPRLGDRVVVGANATLLGPIEVGDDAVIGAQALVTADVAASAHLIAPRAVTASRGSRGATVTRIASS